MNDVRLNIETEY